MKRFFLDWKFALNALIGLAALALTIYFGRADLSAHSLTVRLVSSSALELPTDSKIHDLQVIVNGIKIDSPYVYSLVLVNSGSKPIPAGSFESPLQIGTTNDGKLLTAQITETAPADIPVKLSIDENQIKILPFLSNPNDQIAITLVSSGPLQLAPHARIEGVQDIIFEDTSQNKTRPLEATFFAIVSVLCLSLYLFLLPTSRSRGEIRVSGGIRFLCTFVLLASGVYFVSRVGEELGFGGSKSFIVMIPLFVIAGVITVLLELSNRSRTGTSST